MAKKRLAFQTKKDINPKTETKKNKASDSKNILAVSLSVYNYYRYNIKWISMVTVPLSLDLDDLLDDNSYMPSFAKR